MSRQVAQPQKKRLALRRRRGRSRSPDPRRACLFEALEGRCLFSADPALQTLLEVAEPTESGALIPTEETTLNFTPVEWHPVGGVTGDALGEGGPVTENLPMAAEDIIWLVPQYNPYDQVDGGAPNLEIAPLRAGTPEGAFLPMMPGGEHATIDRAGADSTGARRVVRPPEPEPRPVFKGEIAYVEPTFLTGSSLAGLARDPARALTADERPNIEYILGSTEDFEACCGSGNVLDDTSARSTDLAGDIAPAADRAIVELVGLATLERPVGHGEAWGDWWIEPEDFIPDW